VPTIARHETDEANASSEANRLPRKMQTFIDLIKKNPTSLHSVLTRALDEAGYRCIADPIATWLDTWNSVVLAMQSASAIFVAGNQTDGEVEFSIRDDVVRIPATGPTIHTDAGIWIKALWLAMICRERQRIDMLCATPIELLRASDDQYDEYIYTWVRALQIYWRQQDGLVDTLLRAMQGTEPESIQAASEEVVLQLLYPPIEMFYFLTQREDEKFNNSLANALELHKRFWTKDAERRNDPNGFIALGPLAIACLARDAGVPIEVESEYLPKHLLEGTWVGEHAT
jgi:hypothetical protein